MKRIISIMLTAIFALGCFSGCGKKTTSEKITVSFAEKDGKSVQNLKKIDLFTSDWTWVGTAPGTIDEDILSIVPAMKDLNTESHRFGMGIGTGYNSLGYYIGHESDGSDEREYSSTLRLVNEFKKNDVQPYFAICYCPDYARVQGTWKSVPDATKYETFCRNLVNVMKNNDINGIYEIGNEPDNAQFFSGDWADYVKTYIAGSKGVRAADEDAVLVGMSAAWMKNLGSKQRTYTVNGNTKTMTDLAYFIERTYDNYLPDALSWHYYGQNGELENLGEDSFSSYLKVYRDELNEYTKNGYTNLETVQTHLNEFNVFIAFSTEKYMYSALVPEVYRSIQSLLSATDVTSVNWAALAGEKSDGLSYELINSLSYERYPAFYALWSFGRLPVDKVKTDIKAKDIISYAGVDDGRAGVILCNNSDKSRVLSIQLKDIPFAKANATAYLIDDTHKTYSSSNTPYIFAKNDNVDTKKGLYLNVELQPDATVYVELNNADGTKTDTEYMQDFGEYVRADYWYAQRADNAPYADVHQRSLATYLGMCDNSEGKTAASVLLKNLKKDSFKMNYEVYGNPVSSKDAALGFRIDYKTASGEWSNSTFYYIDGFSKNIGLPFFDGKEAMNKRSIGYNLKGEYTLDVKTAAPQDWTGEIRISYVMQNCGNGATAKFMVK